MASVVRPVAGRRPVTPVRQDEPPADYLCTWMVVQPVWSSPEPVKAYWELKYINAVCPEHARLLAA